MSNTLAVKVRNITAALLRSMLPRRTKRLILYSSLTAMIRQESELDVQTLTKLNRVMGLSSEVDALKLPVYLREAIWRGREEIRVPATVYSDQPDSDTIEHVVSDLNPLIPGWLRYGVDSEINSEMRRFLMHGIEFLDRRRWMTHHA